jgi:tRNA threonylcarbamoyladenosine modification (KEOPS) complex  Pcc1 subunit
MNYTGQIIVEKGDVDKLYKALIPETMNTKMDRSEFTVQKKGGKLKIDIKAQDSVALRATLNNITKLLTVYEKSL